MISQYGLVKMHMCTYCNAASINTRNIFKCFRLTFLRITSSPLQKRPPNGELLHSAPEFLLPFPEELCLVLQYPPEIVTDTCMSENVVHYNLNIRVMDYETDFYYNARSCKR